jgi:hypothetical protein
MRIAGDGGWGAGGLRLARRRLHYRVACELALDLAPDWRKLDRRPRDHQDKIRNVLTMDYFQSEIRADDSDLKDYAEDLAKVPFHNRAKNPGQTRPLRASTLATKWRVGRVSPRCRTDASPW